MDGYTTTPAPCPGPGCGVIYALPNDVMQYYIVRREWGRGEGGRRRGQRSPRGRAAEGPRGAHAADGAADTRTRADAALPLSSSQDDALTPIQDTPLTGTWEAYYALGSPYAPDGASQPVPRKQAVNQLMFRLDPPTQNSTLGQGFYFRNVGQGNA